MAEKGGIPQLFTTGGNIVHPVEALESDAGCGKPPKPDAYGPVGDASMPTGSKMPGGNEKAMKAWFGSEHPGGGKK
jgi:hypothetical protein